MDELKRTAVAAVDRLAATLEAVSREIHGHPELRFEESRAAALLSRELEAGGFQVQRGVAGLATALRAEHAHRASGPGVAVLAEYDALPEIGHGCGHNLIAAAALGAALAVSEVKRQLPGRFLLMGTPGEEGGGGKILMIRGGVFAGVDVAVMAHPSSRGTCVDEQSLARTELAIAFRGRASHASTSPEKGINALDAVIQTFNAVSALRQHIRDGTRIHGIITNGGVRPNIIPEYASALFYVRAPDDAYRDTLIGRLRACAEGAALATGASAEVQVVGEPYRALRANKSLARAYEANLALLCIPAVRPTEGAGLGSTDMADVSQLIPAIHARFQIAEATVAGHSREFAEASVSERAHRAMLGAAKALAMTTVDLLRDAELLGRVRVDFSASP